MSQAPAGSGNGCSISGPVPKRIRKAALRTAAGAVYRTWAVVMASPGAHPAVSASRSAARPEESGVSRSRTLSP